jgi:hypothetical protein
VVLEVLALVARSAQRPPEMDVFDVGPYPAALPLLAVLASVNGSTTATTLAFAEPDTATAATTPEMKVEVTRIAELLERCPARTPTLPCRQ